MLDHMVQFSSVQSLSNVRLFVTHGLQHTRPPCPSPTPVGHWKPPKAFKPGKDLIHWAHLSGCLVEQRTEEGQGQEWGDQSGGSLRLGERQVVAGTSSWQWGWRERMKD